MKNKKRLVFIILSVIMSISVYAQDTTENPYLVTDSLKAKTSDEFVIPGVIGQSKTFYLKDGNIFNGRIDVIDDKGNVTLMTDEGKLFLPHQEILEETVQILKKDGTNLSGKLLGEDEMNVLISNKYGRFSVSKAQIEKMERFFGGQAESRIAKKRFFAGEEQITSLFLDPTAFIMPPYTFYITGFSMGYGFSNRMQLFTRIPNNFSGDINLSPRVVLFQKSNGAEKTNLAWEVTLYSNHDMLNEYAKYYDEGTLETPIQGTSYTPDEMLKKLYGEHKQFFWETAIMYGKRIPLKSGRGNWSYHAGLLLNQMTFEKPKTKYVDSVGNEYKFTGGFNKNNFEGQRAFFGIDYDLTRRIKFISEIFYDPGNRYVTLGESLDDYFSHGFITSNSEGERKEVDFDFGLTFAPNETLRLGLHFQQPFITIYWKFLDY